MASVETYQEVQMTPAEEPAILGGMALGQEALVAPTEVHTLNTPLPEPAPAPGQKPHPIGIEEVWTALEEHQIWLRDTVTRLLGTSDEAASTQAGDIVNEVIISAADHALDGTLVAKDGIQQWLYHTAFYAVRQQARSERHSPEQSLEAAIESTGGQLDQDWAMTNRDGALERRVEVKISVADALHQLPDMHRQVLAMRLGGLSRDEIANLLGMHPDKVRRTLGQAERLTRHHLSA